MSKKNSPIWKLIEIYEVKDPLWDWFMTRLGGKDSGSAMLVWPKAYKPLYEAATGPLEQVENKMEIFLSDWYANIKNCSWYDSHLSPHPAYVGYWSLEAAAIAKLRKIDDTNFRSHPNYPA